LSAVFIGIDMGSSKAICCLPIQGEGKTELTVRDPEMKTYSPRGERVIGFLNPFRVAGHLWQYRQLISQLTRQQVRSQYKGSLVGIGWSLIHPLLMLCVYTFVFSVVFQARFGVQSAESRFDFALALFIGLVSFRLFTEVVNSAPSLIFGHVNYVKKVVFPLEILVVVNFLGSLINALFSLFVFLCGAMVIHHTIPWTTSLLPLVWLPLILLTLGCGYFLASFGVFLRDLDAATNVITTMLFFLTPIFYPLSAVPERFRIFSLLNPLTTIVENTRAVTLGEALPDWVAFSAVLTTSALVCLFGFIWFMKSKKAFADVI
jgi:lipopolysaccharide transport system permease protein